jgi:hypothetical protein
VHKTNKQIWLGLLLIAVAAVAGCGSNSKPLVQVTGRVTYGGGEWPFPGYITFSPIESSASKPARPGSGRFGVDGKYVVGSYRSGDGLLPGRYHVSVSCLAPEGTPNPPTDSQYVPADFTTEELVVEAGQDAIELDIDVPKKK